MPKNTKFVYFFGGGKAEGKASMRDILGGKGAGLHEMTRIGVPVPPGFTITTDVCTYYYAHRGGYPKGLEIDVIRALKRLERKLGKRFGDTNNPLLVSVRSGARESMPGMMDTVLNLGLNDQTLQGLIHQTADPRFGYDTYRRFVHMYSDVVLGVRARDKTQVDPFEKIMADKKHDRGIQSDTELTGNDLKEIVDRYKAAVKAETGKDFPDDPIAQLWGAIGAVLALGTTTERLHTVSSTTYRPNGERRLIFRRWFLAISARLAPRELRLPEIPLPERRSFMANSW
jgi:pyruvate,orthophosphate dikinase